MTKWSFMLRTNSDSLLEQHTVVTYEPSLQPLQVSGAGESVPWKMVLCSFYFLILSLTDKEHPLNAPLKTAGVTLEFLVLVLMTGFMVTSKTV